MAREIITSKDLEKTKEVSIRGDASAQATDQRASDDFKDRLIKYIPAEILTVYIFVEGIIRQYQNPQEINGIYWAVFIIFWILTPVYLWKVANVKKSTQLIVSFLAFFVWVFALGGPFLLLGWYKIIYGAILLPVFTFAAGMFKPEN